VNPAELAKLIEVSGDTLRRWTREYRDYLSPSATPPKGQPRIMTEHDQRVMLLIRTLRNAGQDRDAIILTLQREQENGWSNLPPLPENWGTPTIRADVAASRASELATVAALQTQLQHVTKALEDAQRRVASLEEALAEAAERERALREESIARERALRDQAAEVERERQELQIRLLEAKGDVTRLEGDLKAYAARLEAYSFGRERPIHIVYIVAGALLFGALLVALIFVIASLI
jgi:DNA-binding transcriptional MerR regulator